MWTRYMWKTLKPHWDTAAALSEMRAYGAAASPKCVLETLGMRISSSLQWLPSAGHLQTPEDFHLSTSVGAMGDIRASVCLRGVTSLFPPCLSVLLSAGCFRYITGGHYNFLHKPLACRAKGLISSYWGSQAAELCWEWCSASLQGYLHRFSDILYIAVLHLETASPHAYSETFSMKDSLDKIKATEKMFIKI